MRILYGIQGTGNGHITRARVMATTFKALGVDVDYVFSGRKEQDYFDMDDFADYRAFRGLSFTSKSGQVDSFKTLKNARPLQLIKDIKNECDLKYCIGAAGCKLSHYHLLKYNPHILVDHYEYLFYEYYNKHLVVLPLVY